MNIKGFAKQKQKSKIYIIGFIIVLFLNLIPIKTYAAVSPDAIFNLTNSARTQNGLNTLSMNSQLNTAAQMKAQDMLTNGYFAHTSPSGLNSWYWFKQVNYDYKTAGENLAIDFSDSNSVFNAWMNSPSHRDNILDPDFQEIGISAITGNFNGSTTTVVVQMFGAQNGSSKVTQNNSKTNNSNKINIQTKKPSATTNTLTNSVQNQKYDLTSINTVFNKFKLAINNVSDNFKGVFVQQVILSMLI
jgi:hypothetical protein